jgi:hypothetical protein
MNIVDYPRLKSAGSRSISLANYLDNSKDKDNMKKDREQKDNDTSN